MRTKEKLKNPILNSLSELELPYSFGLLFRHKLIRESADSREVMRVTQRVVRDAVVSKRRAMGLPLSTILHRMSARSVANLRKRIGAGPCR